MILLLKEMDKWYHVRFLKQTLLIMFLTYQTAALTYNGSAIVNCDFDNQTTCNWQETNFIGHHWYTFDNRLISDHTGKLFTGHLLCADPNFLQQNTTVELISPSLPPTPGLVCFSFWYNLYKPGLSDLRVTVIKPSKTLNIWQVDNQVITSWRRAGITLASDEPFQFSFHFTTGTVNEGSIVIDDIKLSTGPCTRKDVFNFESGYDDFTRMYDNVFDWQLKNGGETSARSDHTYMSPYGKLLYADMRNHSSGDMSSVLSATFPPAHEECLYFWYIKRGSNTSTFQAFVNLEIPGAGLEIQNVWDVIEPVNEWTRAFVDITSPNPYRVGFQVMVGNNNTHDEVFLDDVSFSTMPCPREVDCDFENSFVCGYQTSRSGGVQWRIVRADDPSSLILTDHTTQSRIGSYMQVDFPTTSTTVLSVDLISQPIPAVVKRCLTFWYSSAGTSNLRVFLKTDSWQSLLLMKAVVDDLKARQERTWHYIETDITDVTVQYTLTFQVEGFPWSSFALDDIKSVAGTCGQLDNGTLVNQATTGDVLDPSKIILGCDFDAGSMCNFTIGQKGSFHWNIFSIDTAHEKGTGLDFDHTLNSRYGKHLYMSSRYNPESALAEIETPIFFADAACVSFWYGMNGNGVGRLTVFLRGPGQYDTILWTKTGNRGPRWYHQTLQVTAIFSVTGQMMPMTIVFQGEIGKGWTGDIDLDDIFIYYQDCPSVPDFCDFEDSNSCNLDQDNMDNGEWVINQRAANATHFYSLTSDHTFQTGEGHYALMDLYNQPGAKTGRLITPFMVADSIQCLSLWYYISNPQHFPPPSSLWVLVRDERGVERVLAKLIGEGAEDWTAAHIVVSHNSTERVQIIFESHVERNTGAFGIDDIEFSPDECFNTVNCQFHSGGLCNWHQDVQHPNPPWLAQQDASNPSEYYMTVTFTNHLYNRLQVSAVVSELIPNATLNNFCLSFRYKLSVNYTGFLNVSIVNEREADPDKANVLVFSVDGNDYNSEWQTAYINRPDNFTADLFQFVIAATGSKTLNIDLPWLSELGTVKITDVKLSPKSCLLERNSSFLCPYNQTKLSFNQVCDFKKDCLGPDSDDESNCGNCDFQSGFCQWQDISSGSTHFVLGYNSTSSYLPTNDHGSDGGNYLFIEGTPNSAVEHIDLVLTQELGPSPPSCYLNFHYYMWAQPDVAMGDLLVVLEESDEETILWRGLRIPSLMWHEANVPIDNIGARFKIHLRVNRLVYLQYLGIDDIKLKGCTFSEPALPSCQPSQFQCNTSHACIDPILQCNTSHACIDPILQCNTSHACIDPILQCDFTEDCLDGSDEEDSVCGSYTMDDFEHSLGNWRQSMNDDFDWSRHQGQSMNVYNGPRRDHTLGTHFGHYMLFEAAGHRSGQKAQLLSPVFTPVQNDCWMVLVVYMYGANSADLRITTRTTKKGPEKVLLEITRGLGDTWQYKRIQLQSADNFQVVIEGVVTGVSSMNIGIDDITFTPQCQITINGTLPDGIPSTTPRPLCPVGQFQCDSGPVQCVNQTKVCDFISQCEDSSDEIGCGSCTFENNECGWYDESIGNKIWTLVKAGSSSSSPLTDHTTEVPGQGTFLSVVDGLGDIPIPATIVGPILTSTGADCAMSAYILVESGSTNGSIEFGLRNGTDPFKTTITSATVRPRPTRTTGQWLKYSYHIGSLPAGYQVFMKAINVSSRQLDSYFYVDDFFFENCEQNVSSTFSTASCDFEGGWCNWFNDYTQTGEWMLANKDQTFSKVGPEHDHTTGSGYFAYVDLETGQRFVEVSAKLITGLLDPGKLKNGCLSFFYHTFGTNINLSVFLVGTNSTQLIFVQTKTENSWQLGRATISPSGLFQISFVGSGTMVKYNGHIAIDDVTLDNSPCPITTDCNFESDMCGYTQNSTDHLHWTRIQASDIAEGDPTVDHTTLLEKGHYIKMDVHGQSAGYRSALVSPIYTGQPGLKCLTFWYFVEVSKNGSMEVFYWPNGSADAKSLVWSHVGSFPRWMLAQATLNTTTNYKISFEGVVPDVDPTDYSVDDIFIEDGQCPPVGSCDFERDGCGFTWDSYLWTRDRGLFSSGDPPVDHTTGTSRGFFLSMQMDHGYIGTKIEIRSQWINKTDPVCLSFWYFVNSASAPVFSIEVLTSTTDDPLERWSVHRFTKLQPDEWQKLKINFTEPRFPFYFIIAGVIMTVEKGTLTIDDVYLTDGDCQDRIVSTIPPPDTRTIAPSSLDCSFETLCQWTQGIGDDFDWLITSKSPMKFSGNSYDHTTDNDQGSFIMTNPSINVPGHMSRLVSPKLEDLTKGLCLKFWYFMSGPSAGTLNIKLMKDSTNSTVVWHRSGEQGEDWLPARVFISQQELTQGHPQTVNIIIENVLASQFSEDIRIDDVTAVYSHCEEDLRNCDFESQDMCGFSQDLLDNGDWIVSDGQNVSSRFASSPQVDHTYGTSFGHFLYINASKFQPQQRAGIISKTLVAVHDKCLRFFYHMYGDDMGMLSVKIFSEEGDVTLVWSHEGNAGDTWRIAHVTLNSDLNFQIAFEAILKSQSQGDIAIDDISLLTSPCPQPASCDFETDLCSYQNVKDSDDFDWVRHSGPTVNDVTGPSRDHTTNSSSGHYLYTLNVLRHRGKSARLMSELLQQTDGSCLSFFYYMRGQGTLLVWLDFDMYRLLATVTEDTGDRWKQKFLNVSMDSQFVIVFESQITMEGQADTAIDDISYTSGLCTAAEEISQFVCTEDGTIIPLNKRCNFIRDCKNGSDEVNCGNCTFQYDLCGYREISEGSFHWVIASNHTMKSTVMTSGLGYDHTENSPYGNMLYVDTVNGRDANTAVIESPLLQRTYQSCKLQFYYKFSGPLSGEISVGVKFDWSTGVFSTGFTQNRVYNLDSWHLAEVDIGYVAESFYIVIMTKKSYLSTGTIAIDDVSLVDCGPPAASPLLCSLPSYFKCATGYCVDQKVVCDLAQDCGDGSDEAGCQYITACTFENSLCDWQQESTSATSWKIGTGGSRDTSVSRDHTLGTSSGHYLYLSSSTSQNNRGGNTARLVSPTFQSTSTNNKTCQLTLYYYMKNNLNNSITLSVSLRTTSGGYETRLFSRQRGDFSAWERYVIPIVSNQDFQILIEASSGVGATVTQAVLGVDDTVFSSGCNIVPYFLPTPNYTVTTQPVTTSSCSSGQHQCPDGKCILQTFVCDMKTDCADGSDEIDCGPCEFETGTCGWYSISTGSIDWGVSTSGLMGIVGPTVDTTYNNASGHYLYVKPSYGLGESQAELSSGPLPAIISNCTVTLQYYVNPSIIGHLSLSTYYQGLSVPLMTIKVDPLSTPGWQERTFSFFKNVEESSQLVLNFQADNINGSQIIAAVDSIRFHGCSKQDEVINLNCSFDYKNLCQWKQSSQDVFDWVFSGSDVLTPNGPKRDHSPMGSGYYLLAKSQNRHMKDTTVIISPVISPDDYDGHCLSFWYYMNGVDVGSLRVEMYNDQTNIILYERVGSLQNRWSEALVPVRTLDTYKLGIKAEVTGGYNGDIAIDDLQFSGGACLSPNECMYEDNNFCDWYENAGDTIHWALGSKAVSFGSVPSTDHTLNTRDGHFAYVQTNTPGSATLRSTLKLSSVTNASLCLQFWYHMVGERQMQLNTYAMLQDGQTRTFLSLHGPSEDLWRKASVPITPVTGAYELQISAVVQGGVGHVAIDDLVLQQDRCPSQGDCSFSDDMCSFTAMSRGAEYEWVLHNDNPAAGASSNSFVLAQATTATDLGDSAVLLSEVVTAVGTSLYRCLQFSAQLRSNSSGPPGVLLNVYTRGKQGRDKMLIGTLDTFVYNKWSVYKMTLEAQEDFEFFFEAVCVARTDAGVALDNITLNVGSCADQGYTPSTPQSTKPISSSEVEISSTTKVCPGTFQCLRTTERCVVLCDGLQDCVDGSDERNCGSSTQTKTSGQSTATASPNDHVISNGNHGDENNDDTWKLPVGISLGLLLAAIVIIAIILFIRHRRRIPFKELDSEESNQTLRNPAYMYGANNPAMMDEPSAFPGLEKIDC